MATPKKKKSKVSSQEVAIASLENLQLLKGEWSSGVPHPREEGRYTQTEHVMAPSENIFCRRCSALYDYSKAQLRTRGSSSLVCSDCGYREVLQEDAVLQARVTVVERRDPPWWLLETERTLNPGQAGEGKQYAEIEQECPQCLAPKVQFWTRQLRSADEGQTVFTLCKKCGWR
eukprot:CAMPEP_0178445130 /NCGR_PEP_ID=MMETSP0689_2-20121128/39968_1 /TAXON_ID=160604 /ORGANISM="Amphidinium massartii, Strain CS-259" /LENGTH=173 /DNA_ID=CAMNT_0020069591 /DNA_START=1 /DNA_END=518 /DNA_ORIENTATION=+